MSTSGTWDAFLGSFGGSASTAYPRRCMRVSDEIPDVMVLCEGQLPQKARSSAPHFIACPQNPPNPGTIPEFSHLS